MTDFGSLLGELAGAGVEYIVVGGFAAATHGSTRFTSDLDIVYRRCLSLRRLIEVKRAAGRPKDLEAIAELELLLKGDADP